MYETWRIKRSCHIHNCTNHKKWTHWISLFFKHWVGTKLGVSNPRSLVYHCEWYFESYLTFFESIFVCHGPIEGFKRTTNGQQTGLWETLAWIAIHQRSSCTYTYKQHKIGEFPLKMCFSLSLKTKDKGSTGNDLEGSRA